ncbi:BspA family leucine-rich repeat surface protein [Flavobacteriaceae bacterium]|nr:BspA family leucine-rich repeat surface protein [Flavobacteriaceae bacterium]
MKKYTLLFIALFIVSCSDNDDTEPKPFYVADNGVTIKARDWVTIGTTADLNGVTYTAVDLPSLKEWVKDGKDLNKVVTTKVEVELSGAAALFFRSEIKGIEGWDVSNWKSMDGLFYSAQPVTVDLSAWDVSKVIYMGLTMMLGDVNPNINNWDVSSATNMTGLVISGNSNYIEGMDLSGWDVSKVTECNGLTNNFNAYNWPESKRPNFTNCNPD